MPAAALTNLGKTDWIDYTDYWRDDDAEWLQERTILRYATSAARGAPGEWPAPTAGQVTYNQETDQLEHFTLTAPTKWIGVLASQHLRITPKTSTNDSDPAIIGHRNAGGQGIQFWPTVAGENKVSLPSAFLDVGNGAVVAKATSFTVTTTTNLATTTIKTGTKIVTLTTSATDLVSNSPLNVPSLTTVGMNFTGVLSGTGASSIVNANAGTIGGVVLSASYAQASSGYVSQGGYFHGDGVSAYMRYRNPGTGGTTAAYARVDPNSFTFNGSGAAVFDIWNSDPRIFGTRSIHFYNAAATVYLGPIGPVVVSGGDPGAGNYPEGTIWCT
jgi:hypothetical protein